MSHKQDIKDCIAYMEAWDDGDAPDGAWECLLKEGVESFNEVNNKSLDPHETFIAYVEHHSF